MEELNSKIRTMMENREFPEELKNVIESVYREYEQFYDENIRPAINLPSVEEFFQYEHKNAMQKIFDNYRIDCEQKGEDVINFLRIEDENEEKRSMQKVDEEIEEIITNSANNNYGRITRITDIVVDSLRSSRNQLFMTIAGYTVDDNQKSQIDEEINGIKTRAIQKIEDAGTEIFSLDDKQIAQQIIDEYEQYIEDNGITMQTEKSAHERFVEEYAVSQDQLIPINKDDNENKEPVTLNSNKEEIKPDIEMI